MSSFDTEEAHTVVLAKGKDGGGRSTPQGMPKSVHLDICRADRRPPGSSAKSRLNAPPLFGVKRRHPYPSLFYGVKGIIE